jgi:hypothetical protein
MLRLKPSNVCPPDKFSFQFPDGHIVYAIDKEEWFEKIKKYADDNQYPVPSKEEAEDQLCRRLSGEWCDGGDQYSFISTRFTLHDFIRGTRVLGSFALGAGRVVDQGTASRRALICSRCFANVRVPGCSSCTGMANAVAEIKGKKGTPYDHLLKACGVCHCSNEAQVWIPAEHLKKGVTDEQMEKYKQIPECWKKDELLAIQRKSENNSDNAEVLG